MLKRLKFKYFSFADMFQQMVGGFLLAGPFVVTEEVWRLAENIMWYHSMFLVMIVFGIGYGALYKADEDRDPDKEVNIMGVPVRFISLMLVSYLSVAVLITLLNAPVTFDASRYTMLKVISIASVFSVIGAATVDSVL